MLSSADIDQLATALSAAQGEFIPATRSGFNPFTKKGYSTLADVIEVSRAALAKNGLCVVQTPEISDNPNLLPLTTRLLHASGQWVEGTICFPLLNLDKKTGAVLSPDAQAYMSALTYARRGGYCALVGIAYDPDDDGNETSGKTRQAPAISVTAAGVAINTGQEQCPSCHAPAGKAHTATCQKRD